ncbi:MAG: hypothetical protein EXR64_03540 [Dehalococcoidia bacterium]|nr:hypothetical protein [Dehalococcoidia bacterium]
MSGPSLFRRRTRSRVPSRVPAELLARGRERVDALSGSLAETLSPEAMTALLRELQRDAAPLIERATGRKRRRGPGRGLVMLLLFGAAAGVCYLLWQRREEHPAYLMDAPERPSITPAGSPDPAAPSATPGAPFRPANEEDSSGALRLARSMADRELAGAQASASGAHRDVRDAARDLRARESTIVLPPIPGASSILWASGRPQVPGGSGPSLPH